MKFPYLGGAFMLNFLIRPIIRLFVSWPFEDMLSDETCLRFRYYTKFLEWPNFDNPRKFNEKMQWLKLYNHRPEYVKLVDKYEVKKYVSGAIGEQYVIPTLGVWEQFDDIDFDLLPNQFVLKCTHDSGSVMVVRDKSKFDKGKAKEYFDKALKENYFWAGREWYYKNIKPRIIAEEYVEDNQTEVNKNGEKCLSVYKFFSFNGEPKIIQTIKNDKTSFRTIDYFNLDWERLPFRQQYPTSEIPVNKPQKLQEMIELVRKLSAGIHFVRVDLYEVNGDIKFSEFTFFSDAGYAQFYPTEWDTILGSWIKLPEEKTI